MAEVIDILLGMLGLFGKVDFPAMLKLCLKKLAPFPVVLDELIADGR